MLNDVGICFMFVSDKQRGKVMFKNLLVFMALVVPTVAVAAPKKEKKEEPIVHLTDKQIYEELKKLALVFEVARANFVEEADEKKDVRGRNEWYVGGFGSTFVVFVGRRF